MDLLIPKLKRFNFPPLWWKKSCPYCSQSNVKKNGLYSNKKQRWYCHNCKTSFLWRIPDNKSLREIAWFKYWISEGFSVRQLQLLNNHSESKLRRIINRQLERMPPDRNIDYAHCQYLIFDGTFLHGRKGILALMNARTNTIIAAQYGLSESSQPHLMSFFEPLKQKGLNPLSCTVDGNPQVIRTLKKLWPSITIQRCLVHIQRQGLMWCRQKPKRPDAVKFREIFLQVPYIKTKFHKERLRSQILEWENRYGQRIAQLPERGWVLSDLKRARSMLLRALPDMFRYLDSSHIPSSTNGLEGYFSRLKQHYRHHRGLAPSKRHNYFKWYAHFRPR